MYFSLIIIFLLLLAVIITAVQNTVILDFRFIVWNLQISLTALIFFSSLAGGAIVAILTLPKLVRKSLDVRRLKQDINKCRERVMELEKVNKSGFREDNLLSKNMKIQS